MNGMFNIKYIKKYLMNDIACNGFVWFMVFTATFNNISVILWWSVLLVEETGGPVENHLSAAIY
jgi:hypothetical protein